jgi:putative ABC transport system ATP-binding protein
MLLHVNNLVKDYKLGKTVVNALRKISFTVEEGEFLAIVGPSGSGKTTLLNILGCLDTPTSGKVFIQDKDISSLSDNRATQLRLEKIGFIFQTFNLIPVLNVYENIEYPLILERIKPAERKKCIISIVERVGLADHIKHKPDELSGGQRQRVAIARALVTNPGIVFADEPTANLDGQTGDVILNLMLEMNNELKTTFIFSTHDSMVMEHAKRKIFLRDGQIEKIES